jgi:hypothetical protein
LTGDPVRRVIIAGAFYDEQLAFVSGVQRELKPDEVILAVEPETVEMPAGAAKFPGIRVVRADTLGLDESKVSTKKAGYLHAKGIFIEPRDGEAVFASGSANPSRPPWFAEPDSGNVEVMLASVGETALDTARSLGFLGIPDMPTLSFDDWKSISGRTSAVLDTSLPPFRTGMVLAAKDEITIRRFDIEGLEQGQARLLDELLEELPHTCVPNIRGDLLVLQAPAEITVKTAFVRFQEGERVLAQFLVHHENLIEELSRTGVQRRFRDALASLETDAPDLETLLQSVERILFEDERTAKSSAASTGKKQGTEETQRASTVTTLAVNIDETKKSKKAHRLLHSSDLSYLIDALIYHLRIDQDQAVEELDVHGRNEEEQVGADDEDDASEPIPGFDPEEVLRICHRKVRTLVNRMCRQLDALTDGEQALDRVLIRLTGVLALLRQLRRCDGKVSWVDKGKTAVPRKQREQLLEKAMYVLFEGKHSLLHLENVDQDLAESDDIARLKGLLIWLAWECGVRFRVAAPFMESTEEQEERLATNAIVLALLQVIRGDDVVIDEAKECIGGLSSGELDWLKTFLGLASRIEALRDGTLAPSPPS